MGCCQDDNELNWLEYIGLCVVVIVLGLAVVFAIIVLRRLLGI